MKNEHLLLVFLLVILQFSLNAQIKVISDGKVGIATPSPQHTLHINQFNSTNTSLQVGGFGVQSLGNANGFLIGNGYWQSGVGGFTNINNGFSMVQLLNGKVALRTADQTPPGTVVSLKNTLTAAETGFVGIGGSLSPSYRLHVYGNAYKTSGGDHWNMASDRNLKKNVKKFNSGLDIIKNIEPVEYQYNGKAGTTNNEYQIGIIAQDLQKIAPWMVSKTKIIESDIDEFGKLQILSEDEIHVVNASSLKWILVNSVKELEVKLEERDKIIDKLIAKIERLEEEVELLADNQGSEEIDILLEDNLTASSSNKVYISQNVPNPFSEKTFIEYNIPENYANKEAKLIFMNNSSQIIKSIQLLDVSSNNKGRIDIQAGTLADGIYYYYLELDGEKISEIYKMIFSN